MRGRLVGIITLLFLLLSNSVAFADGYKSVVDMEGNEYDHYFDMFEYDTLDDELWDIPLWPDAREPHDFYKILETIKNDEYDFTDYLYTGNDHGHVSEEYHEGRNSHKYAIREKNISFEVWSKYLDVGNDNFGEKQQAAFSRLYDYSRIMEEAALIMSPSTIGLHFTEFEGTVEQLQYLQDIPAYLEELEYGIELLEWVLTLDEDTVEDGLGTWHPTVQDMKISLEYARDTMQGTMDFYESISTPEEEVVMEVNVDEVAEDVLESEEKGETSIWLYILPSCAVLLILGYYLFAKVLKK
ncbi:hypothetical protein [Lederbergia graminis]|uniref:Uncharacterized protein n=1 Tax=Lederbergia graminis TaxID=735518 RepID=A0ABW0LL17_9BACI